MPLLKNTPGGSIEKPLMFDDHAVPQFALGKGPSDVPRRTPSPTTRARSPPLKESRDERAGRWTDKNTRTRGTQPMRDVILLGLDADVDADKLRLLVSALADASNARLAAPPSDVTEDQLQRVYLS